MNTLARACASLALLILAPFARAQTPEPTDRWSVIVAGWVLDVPGQEPKRDAMIVVRNGRIERVVPGTDPGSLTGVPADRADVIRLPNAFVLPGLIDCHVHITFQSDAQSRMRALTEDDAAVAIRGVVFAERTLRAGFTTVRDVGSRRTTALSLRDAIARGDIPGPTILASGESLSVTGGHGDPTNGYRWDLFGLESSGVADGADECRRSVREQIKRGADLIKMTATGGVLSASTAGLRQHFFDDELRAVVETAHAMGRKVAAHAHGTDGINAALRAGVDSIEHGTYLDDESIRLFKQTGAYLVPTLLAGDTVARQAEVPGYYLPMVAAKAREVGPRMIDMFRKAHAGGVKIAFGTDSGVSVHGENAKEFALMIKGGMTPAEAVRSATVAAADLLGLASDVGTLEPGKRADIIAVAADPLADVTSLERVGFVMVGGRVHVAWNPDAAGR